jgi:hypothetical protein
VLASYRHEFRYMTISAGTAIACASSALTRELIPPGIDLAQLPPREPSVARREDMLLALGRSTRLKNLPLTLAAWRACRAAP